MEPIKKDDKYYRAKEQVRLVKKFYMSLVSFVIFISFLACINYYVNGLRQPWFLWAALGWGIGLFFSGAKAFKWNPFFGSDWEKKKMKEFMDGEDTNTQNKQNF